MSDIARMEMGAISEWLESIITQEWRWSEAEWPSICRSLGLTETARAEKAGYSRHEYALGSVVLHAMGHGDRVFSVDVDVWTSRESEDRGAWLEAYASVIQVVERRLGTPVFRGSGTDPAAPADQSAEMIAMWNLPTARVLVLADQRESWVPMVVTIRVSPPTSG